LNHLADYHAPPSGFPNVYLISLSLKTARIKSESGSKFDGRFRIYFEEGETKMKTPIIVAIVVVLIAVVGVGAFFAGSSYGQQQAQNTRAEFFNARQGGGAGGQNSQNGQGGQQFGRPAATGTVKSISGNALVVTQQDGSTVTVTLDSQTQIIKTVNGTTTDLQPGERITVMSDQTTGNIIARTIQLRPTSQTQ
jgi:hypothetical protein